MFRRPDFTWRMLRPPTWLKPVLTAGAVLAAMPAQALLLEPPQTYAILGQPLRVDIPVRLDASEQLASSCVQAQVDVGSDALRQDLLVVSLRHLGSAEDGIRVRSTVPMTEPYVVLTVKLGCQFQRTQQYTLLVNPPTPELPVVPIEAAATAVSPRHPAVAPATKAKVRNGHAGEIRASNRQEGGPDAARQAERHAARTRKPSLPHRVRPRTAARGAALAAYPKPGSELKLDWLSTELAPSSPLRLSTALSVPGKTDMRNVAKAANGPDASVPTVSPARLAQADLNRKLDALTSQVAELKAARLRDDGELLRLRGQMERMAAAQSGRRMPIDVLGGLAAGFALLSLWLWRELGRRATMGERWLPTAAPEVPADAVPAAADEARHPEDSGPSTWPPEQHQGHGVPTEAEAARTVAQTTQAADWGVQETVERKAYTQPLSGVELVQIDEMMDLRQLAEFFIGIDDPQQAIVVMEKALNDASGGSLALPYLYLFGLYRQHGRKQDYEALLVRFKHRFNVQIPPWDEPLVGPGRDLEAYPRALALICETWDLPPMLTVIERMLLDDPSRRRMGFELPAYRDLLDLYAVARDLSRNPIQPKDQRPVPVFDEHSDLDLPLSLISLSLAPLETVSKPSQVAAPVPAPVPAQQPSLDFTLGADTQALPATPDAGSPSDSAPG
ncbi:hypothetical protein GALL_151870 [mine drainage metagenome]|uniref:Uncharacterized protein n=1 Tax=mine drainage metagenome TaxID=410659 RepID=A0A1J5SRN6_9ZZZZ